mgnify:CR=1 FL=1
MLKVYLNELRKVKRQKTVRMIMLVGVLMPTFSRAFQVLCKQKKLI